MSKLTSDIDQLKYEMNSYVVSLDNYYEYDAMVKQLKELNEKFERLNGYKYENEYLNAEKNVNNYEAELASLTQNGLAPEFRNADHVIDDINKKITGYFHIRKNINDFSADDQEYYGRVARAVESGRVKERQLNDEDYETYTEYWNKKQGISVEKGNVVNLLKAYKTLTEIHTHRVKPSWFIHPFKRAAYNREERFVAQTKALLIQRGFEENVLDKAEKEGISSALSACKNENYGKEYNEALKNEKNFKERFATYEKTKRFIELNELNKDKAKLEALNAEHNKEVQKEEKFEEVKDASLNIEEKKTIINDVEFELDKEVKDTNQFLKEAYDLEKENAIENEKSQANEDQLHNLKGKIASKEEYINNGVDVPEYDSNNCTIVDDDFGIGNQAQENEQEELTEVMDEENINDGFDKNLNEKDFQNVDEDFDLDTANKVQINLEEELKDGFEDLDDDFEIGKTNNKAKELE